MAGRVGELKVAVVSADVAERRRGAEGLAQLGEEAAQASVELVRAAGDADEQVREWAVGALEALGTPEAGQLSGLVEQLGNSRGDAAYWAATLLGRMGREASSALEELNRVLLQSPQMAVRQRCAWAIGKIGAEVAGNVDPQLRGAVEASLQQAAAAGDAQLARQAKEAWQQWSGAR